MANNNITYTPNYNLGIVALDQNDLEFSVFRDVIAGTNNSNMQKIDNAIKNIDDKTKLIDEINENIEKIEENVEEISERVEKLEQDVGIEIDYTKVSNALISTTPPASIVTIVPNPNDTALRSIIISGNTTPVIEPVITTNSGQSVTLSGITLGDGDMINVKSDIATSTIDGVTTNITATSNGQALLVLLVQGGTTIQVSGGATVAVEYNRDINDAINGIYDVLHNLLN